MTALDATPPELPTEERTRLQLSASVVDEIMAAAVDDDEQGFRAAFAALRQLGSMVDLEVFLNSLHVPADAGEWEEGLRRVLLRIPDGWGRWISCDKGWYPLVVRLDQELQALFPDYEVHQVKEKFGGARYYAHYGYRVDDPEDPEPQLPKRLDGDWDEVEMSAWEQAHAAWELRLDAYQQTPAGARAVAELKAAVERADRLIKEFEQESYHSCERCGAPGSLRKTLAVSPWYKTVCDEHSQGYVSDQVWQQWWAEYEPRFRAEQRERERKRHKA